MISPLLNMVRDHKNGSAAGIYSVCSAHEYVLRAAMLNAKQYNSCLLVEATCNQVNQFGGYTGMTPSRFAEFVRSIAADVKFPAGNLILGGDHLGPHVWRNEQAEPAMRKASELVKGYIEAGFSKIHLDASMPCADDISPISERIAAFRTSELCEVVEKYSAGFPVKPVYVIGTEVSVPGGAKEDEGIKVTSCDDVENFLSKCRNEFENRNLKSAWDRVIAVVVQPGVEFGSHTILDYDRTSASSLSRFIESFDTMVYEAHSTDYQAKESLRQMVEDHFCILKVGPWLTFAYREAVYALEEIEQELLGHKRGVELSNLRKVIDGVMLDDPGYWKSYYTGDKYEQAFDRVYSLSDRIRYYWQNPKIISAMERLMKNLSGNNIPLSLISCFFPAQYEGVRDGSISNLPAGLVQEKITTVLKKYCYACDITKKAYHDSP